MELSPVHPILVAAAIVSTPVPHTVQIGVGTHVVPPASLLVVSAVTWGENRGTGLIQRKGQQRANNQDLGGGGGSRPV